MTTTKNLRPRDKVLVTVSTLPSGKAVYSPARQGLQPEVMQIKYAFPSGDRRKYAKTTVAFTNGVEQNYLTTTEWTVTDLPVTLGGPVPVDWK
jgi:hypothetical protein